MYQTTVSTGIAMKSRRLVCPFVALLILFAATTPADAQRARVAGKAAAAVKNYVSKKVDPIYYPLVALLAGVFKFLIGPVTVIGSILLAKAEDNKKRLGVKLFGLFVAIIGGMACAYLWLGAGFSLLGLLSYVSFGWIGAGLFVWSVFFPDAAGESSVDGGKDPDIAFRIPDRGVSHALAAKPAEEIEETNRLKEMAGRKGVPGKRTTGKKKTPVKKVSSKNKAVSKKKSGAKKKANAKKKTPVKKVSAKNKATVKKKSGAKKNLSAKKKSAGKKKTPVKKVSAKNKATVKKKSGAKKKLSAKKKSAGKK